MFKRSYAHVLTWVGFAFTLFEVLEHVEKFIKLADWCSIFLANWHAWTQVVWNGVSSVIRLTIPDVVRSIANSALFILVMAIGIRLSAWRDGEYEKLQMELNPAAYQWSKISSLYDKHGDKLWSGSAKSKRAAQRKIDQSVKALGAELDAAAEKNARAHANEMAFWKSPLLYLFVLILSASLYQYGFDPATPGADLVLIAAMAAWAVSTIVAGFIAPMGRLHDRAWLVLIGVALVVLLSYVSIIAQKVGGQ